MSLTYEQELSRMTIQEVWKERTRLKEDLRTAEKMLELKLEGDKEGGDY